MAKRRLLRQIGITTDGKPVISGVFALKGTRGIPLEIILILFRDMGWVVDWLDYMSNAQKDGAKYNTVKANILSATNEVFGIQYSNKIGEKLQCSLLAKNTAA